MPTVSQIIKFRTQRRAREQKNPSLRIGFCLGIVVSLFGVIGILATVLIYTNLTRDLPSIDILPEILDPADGLLFHPTRFYDRTYTKIIYILENPAAAGIRYIRLGKAGQTGSDFFSPYLVDATVAAFDPGLWKHSGFLLEGWAEGAHPTLAQHLVSDLLLAEEPASLQRSIRERLLASQITAQFGREKILEWFLNNTKYGNLIYGADAAAHAYFGKSATELSLAEATMLTAIAKTPGTGSHPSMHDLKKQQEGIFQAMLNNGSISANDAQNGLLEDLHFQVEVDNKSGAPAWIDLVMEQISSQINLERIRRGGFDIVTTLDYELQMQATCATKIQLQRIQIKQDESMNIDIEGCETARLLPNIQLNNMVPLEDVHAEVAILDPHSGQILAFVADDQTIPEPAILSRHTVGTITSPFLYLTAFTRGMNPSTLLWDIPPDDSHKNEEIEQEQPIRAITSSYHGPVRARTALVNDYLAATTEVLNQIRVENVLLTEKLFGIMNSSTIAYPNNTLEDLYSRKISLFDVISAYGILANRGTMVGQLHRGDRNGNNPESLEPSSVQQVIGLDGRIWLDWSDNQTRSIVNPQLAYLATNILSDEIARRPSLGHPNSLEIGRSVAVKVGLTINGEGAWTVGYIPQLVVGVWLGKLESDAGNISWEMPAGLWHAITKYASTNFPKQDFNPPAGISLIQVCNPYGLLVSELCPSIVQEAFLAGHEPTQVDDLYQKFLVNRETGRLATVFTPSDMVEEKIYLVVPPQAIEWARSSGFPIPPDTYDAIYSTEPKSPLVQITHPADFDQVSGQVHFMGNAAGQNFSYFRLQVGQGLYPQEWIQIGKDVYKPSMNGLLASWDTAGLEGLYVVQLVVVRNDQSIERDILQLTVDNSLPEVKVLLPLAGDDIDYVAGENLLIQASAKDNLMLELIEFVVDGELRMTLYQPPFTILWPQRLGEHRLLVRAYDMAGNFSEDEISFSVRK
jgi:membrane carboxypeptidase/penicillin-binding protein